MAILRLSALVLIIGLTRTASASPTENGELPVNMQAALIMKILTFVPEYNNQAIGVHIVGAPELKAALSRQTGKKIGAVRLESVSDGEIPASGVRVLFLGTHSAEAIAYAREKKCLTVTSTVGLLDQGVSLCITSDAGKPKIILNLTASKEEGIQWSPKVLNIAETI